MTGPARNETQSVSVIRKGKNLAMIVIECDTRHHLQSARVLRTPEVGCVALHGGSSFDCCTSATLQASTWKTRFVYS